MAQGQSRVVSITDATEPVTLTEAKNYLRVTNTQDDTKITSQITAARSIAEKYLNRDILPRTREQFILRDESIDGNIELYNGPIDSVDTVTIEGVEAVLDDSYELIGLSNEPLVSVERNSREVKIDYTTEGLAGNETVKQGVLAILAELYEYGEVRNKWIWTILSPVKKLYF